MRPSELLCWVSTPLGSGALFVQEHWLAGLVVAVVLAATGCCIRILNAFLADVEREGGYLSWKSRRYEVLGDRERFRDSRLRHQEGRALTKLESAHQRREYKRRAPSRWDQLRFRL